MPDLPTPEQATNLRTWIDALRSDKYRQTTSYLHTEEGYCCLGVGCDITPEGGHPTWKPASRMRVNLGGELYEEDRRSEQGGLVYEYARGGDLYVMPAEIRERYGITDRDQTHLTDMNDNGRSFTEIADWLETYILNASPAERHARYEDVEGYEDLEVKLVDSYED